MTELNATETTDNDKNGQFIIQRIYVKNISFETTQTPSVFQQKWEPELAVNVQTQHKPLEKDIYEVSLTVTATVKNQNNTAFLAEVEQAGIFTIEGAVGEQLDHVLGSFCPSLLFPYAREAITSEVTRGSFPQLVLAPINFDALYLQRLEEQKQTKQ